MDIHTETIQVSTEGNCDIIDLTPRLIKILSLSKILNGVATIFVPGSTAGITTIEFENGVISDFQKAIERLAPMNIKYSHDSKWGDGNGYSHVRAALLGPSFSVPIWDGHLATGTWQQIVLVDFDNRPRTRVIIVQLIGK